MLLEVHDEEEIAKSPFDYIDIVGVNNRNLKNFAENNVNASLRLIELLPKDIIKISESCISQPGKKPFTVSMQKQARRNGKEKPR